MTLFVHAVSFFVMYTPFRTALLSPIPLRLSFSIEIFANKLETRFLSNDSKQHPLNIEITVHNLKVEDDDNLIGTSLCVAFSSNNLTHQLNQHAARYIRHCVATKKVKRNGWIVCRVEEYVVPEMLSSVRLDWMAVKYSFLVSEDNVSSPASVRKRFHMSVLC